jgi:hypothetical protein
MKSTVKNFRLLSRNSQKHHKALILIADLGIENGKIVKEILIENKF